jgi:hypothetical protein
MQVLAIEAYANHDGRYFKVPVGVSLADLVIKEVLEDLAFGLGQMDSDTVPIVPGPAVVTAKPHNIVLLVTLSLFLVLYDVEENWRRLGIMVVLASVPTTDDALEGAQRYLATSSLLYLVAHVEARPVDIAQLRWRMLWKWHLCGIFHVFYL